MKGEADNQFDVESAVEQSSRIQLPCFIILLQDTCFLFFALCFFQVSAQTELLCWTLNQNMYDAILQDAIYRSLCMINDNSFLIFNHTFQMRIPDIFQRSFRKPNTRHVNLTFRTLTYVKLLKCALHYYRTNSFLSRKKIFEFPSSLEG